MLENESHYHSIFEISGKMLLLITANPTIEGMPKHVSIFHFFPIFELFIFFSLIRITFDNIIPEKCFASSKNISLSPDETL